MRRGQPAAVGTHRVACRAGVDAFRRFRSSEGEEFEIFTTQVLGSGAQGTVYLGQAVASGRRVAVKAIPTWRLILEEGGQESLASIDREFAMLRRMGHHPNLAGLLATADVFAEAGARRDFPKYKFLVMEVVEDARELAEHVALNGPMPEPIANHVFLQVLDGLAHVHGRGVIHRDLKPENVLVSGDVVTLDSEVKLVDFGVAKCVSTGPLKTVVGTPSIMAPEVALAKMGGAISAGGSAPVADTAFFWSTGTAGEARTGRLETLPTAPESFCPKVDVWSAGVVLYTCLTGKLPFKGEHEIIHSDYLTHPLEHVSEEAKDLLASMLEKDPDRRLSLEECLQHPWVACSANDACTIDYDSFMK